jgi:hypothetical protein
MDGPAIWRHGAHFIGAQAKLTLDRTPAHIQITVIAVVASYVQNVLQ